MSLNLSVLKSDLGNVIDDLPVVLTFNGADIVGMSGTVSKDGDVGMMGIAQMSDVEFSSRVDRFTTLPRPKESATLDGVRHIVDRVQVSADGVQVQIYMSIPKAGVSV